MDTVNKATRSKIMSSIRSRHTKPEKKLRSSLREEGIVYKLHYGKEKVDIAVPSRKIAILVDGCFWHCCPKHGHIPMSNTNFWKNKLARNKLRDKRKNQRLKESGWKVIRFWEHDITKDSNACAKKVKLRLKVSRKPPAKHT